ncbi:hypothetical protein SSX86_022901 [Deinandra increscens subsp. villosa]|uniref:Reverse transcriptase zinc-binding domain-containing protein n=1 Tax=Deinandra increscens subsp. villosa TaxID=3103831 RepID=A0AAP0CJW3_9ASTR
MWRSWLDRISTKDALRKRHIGCRNGLCAICEEFDESVDHIFTVYRIADGVWNGIAQWVHLPPIYLFSFRVVLEIANHSGWSKAKKEPLQGLCILTCWRIWKARNEMVFRDTSRNVIEIVSDVKALGYLWYRSRGKHSGVDWKGWQAFNFDVM